MKEYLNFSKIFAHKITFREKKTILSKVNRSPPPRGLVSEILFVRLVRGRESGTKQGGRGATYFIADCELSKPYYLHTLSPKG